MRPVQPTRSQPVKRLKLTRGLIVTAVALFVIGFCWAAVAEAQRAVLVVTSANDSGPNTLRQLVLDAADGDTITFDPSLSGELIVLQSNLPDITKTLTIDGSAAPNLTISGVNGYRSGFNVTSAGNLSIHHLTFANGGMTPSGGAFYSLGTLRLTNVSLLNNSATSSGGAVYSAGHFGQLFIENGVIANNTSVTGGGVVMSANASVISSTLRSNSATSRGGALFQSGPLSGESFLTIQGSTIENNSAQTGGGLSIYVGYTHIEASSFLSNTATTTDEAGGGAIETTLATSLTIEDSKFLFNNAVNSGGALSLSRPATIGNTLFRLNSAEKGGAINTVDGGLVVINTSTLAENSAVHGGAIHNSSPITISNSTLSVNGASAVRAFADVTLLHASVISNSAPSALRISANLTMHNSIVANPNATADCSVTGVATITNSLLQDGSCITAGDDGNLDGGPNVGSLQLNNANLRTHALLPGSSAIDAGNPIFCTEKDQRGYFRHDGACDMGAFEVSDGRCASFEGATERVTNGAGALQQAINAAQVGGTVKVAGLCSGTQTQGANSQLVFFDKSVVVEGGHTPTNWNASADSGTYPTILDADNSGRVVFITQNTSAVMLHLEIINGETSDQGGGIYMADGSSLTLNLSKLHHNNAADGGALYASNNSTLNVNESSFWDNSAEYGGALLNNGDNTTVNKSTFYNNRATIDGGAIGNGGDITLNNSTLSANEAAGDGGGFDSEGTIHVNNSTLNGNSAAEFGGGFFARDTVNVTNSIVANSVGGDCYEDSGPLTINHSLIGDGSCLGGRVGNLNGDPLLDPLADNGGATFTHALQSNSSPAFNGGDNTACLATDQRSVVRTDGMCDMGAYEADFEVPTSVQLRTNSGNRAEPLMAILLALGALLASSWWVFGRKPSTAGLKP